MKTPKTLISEYESSHDGIDTSLRLYTYVRPRKNGEATIEVWGAKNNMRRRGKPMMMKHFFTFRTEDDVYRTIDTIKYTSWSTLAHDHICYHCPEIGGGDYRYHLDDMEHKWGFRSLNKTARAHLPVFTTMLNDFSGTKYKWCAYDEMCGMSAIEYVNFYKRFPKAEILSKMKQFQLLTERFMTKLEDNDFMHYVSRNRSTICLHHMSDSSVMTAYKRNKTCEEYVREINDNRKKRADAAELLRIEEEIKRTEKMRKSYRRWNRKMTALYERIKSICGQYGAYEVVVPKTSDEMLDEGIAMHNCVGKCYTSNHATGHDIIIFLRKNGKPCVDMRIDPRKMEIMECRFICNKDAMNNAEVMEQANKVLANFRNAWKKVA